MNVAGCSPLLDGKTGEMSTTRFPEPDRLHGLAHLLTREFDAPVGLLEPLGPMWCLRLGAPAEAFPAAEDAACLVLGHESRERVFLWRPDRESGPIWLGIPVGFVARAGESREPAAGDSATRPHGRLVALVGFASARGPTDPWGPPCPDAALRAWGEAVLARLRAPSGLERDPEASSRSARNELPLADRLIQRLRISDPPERFQALTARALRAELNVEVVAWVPGSPREPIVVEGTIAGLSTEALRTLIPEDADDRPRVLQGILGAEPRTVALVAAEPSRGTGWLLAVQQRRGHGFAVAELDLLRSAATLLATQRGNARAYGELKDLLFGIVRALTSAIDAKDPYTSGHSERVARIAVRLGEELGLSPSQCGDLYLMGLLHDIGKIGVEDGVLKKPGKLSGEEYRQIQAHVRIGVHILSDLKKLHHLLPGVAHHHECIDGTGYPGGLAGESIPLVARILAVADAYDAMSSSRPYRRRLSTDQIVEIFRRGAGKQWDQRVVDALFACLGDIEGIRSKGLGESLRQAVQGAVGRCEPSLGSF